MSDILLFAPSPNSPTFSFQTISYLAQKGWRGKDPQATDSQCVERHLERISFYGEGDISFGQWVFMKAASAHQPCPEKSCGRIEMLVSLLPLCCRYLTGTDAADTMDLFL
jgi:hypothetical protein